MRLRRGETVLPPRTPPAQTPSLPVGGVIICAVLAGSRLRLHSAFAALRSGCRSTAGAQIITVEPDRMVRRNATRESLLDYIARCAP